MSTKTSPPSDVMAFAQLAFAYEDYAIGSRLLRSYRNIKAAPAHYTSIINPTELRQRRVHLWRCLIEARRYESDKSMLHSIARRYPYERILWPDA